MVEAGHHQEVHLREYLDILQSGGHRAQPVPLQARDARLAPPCPEYGNAGVRMLAGVLEARPAPRYQVPEPIVKEGRWIEVMLECGCWQEFGRFIGSSRT